MGDAGEGGADADAEMETDEESEDERVCRSQPYLAVLGEYMDFCRRCLAELSRRA